MSTAVVQPVPRSFGRMMGRRARDWIPAIVIFVLVIVAWEGLVQGLNVQRFLLPAPSEILSTFWDERVSANNLLLETGANTGLFGVLALAGTLATAAVSALGRLRAADGAVETAAALGLLAALVAHGAVDYTLAFTGPYLLAAFAVGTAAS